jgi:methylmalonyl-CoA/ethylmalonyl-CoA epimerase
MTEENKKKSPFSKLTQIGLVIKDMDATIKKLTLFGIGPFEHRSIPAEAKEYYRDKPLNATFKIAAANVGGVELELIQPVEGESPHQAFLDEKGEGIQHLAFAVENLDEEIERLTKNGASVQLKADLGKLKVAYMDLGTSGLVFELMQIK